MSESGSTCNDERAVFQKTAAGGQSTPTGLVTAGGAGVRLAGCNQPHFWTFRNRRSKTYGKTLIHVGVFELKPANLRIG